MDNESPQFSSRSTGLPVIYLAAGFGSRLGSLTAERPKAMVSVAGRPLIGYALDRLRGAGFERIVAVTGHAAEAFDGFSVEPRFNDRWATDNNIVSLWSVRDLVAGGCTIVNCDVLFDPAIADALAESDVTALLVDDVSPVDDESMKVLTDDDGRLTRLHKSAPIADAVGEYIGLARISPADGPRMVTILEQFVAEGRTDVYYEDAIEALGRERPVVLARVGGLPWVEIDDHDDLARAETEIAPRIDAREVGQL